VSNITGVGAKKNFRRLKLKQKRFLGTFSPIFGTTFGKFFIEEHKI
jgi:hypothetical protein